MDEDFTKPLTIEFEDSTSVIKTSIIESSNQDLWDDFLESCSIHEKNLSIDGMLLNQGESITINVVTEGAAGNIKYAFEKSDISKAEEVADVICDET